MSCIDSRSASRQAHVDAHLVAPALLPHRLGAEERVAELPRQICLGDAAAPAPRAELEVELLLARRRSRRRCPCTPAYSREALGHARGGALERVEVAVAELEVDRRAARTAGAVVEVQRLDAGDLADPLAPRLARTRAAVNVALVGRAP